MSKICPWILLAASRRFDISAFPSPRNQERTFFSTEAGCYEKYCQMWDEKREDCGLKQPSTNQPPQPQANDKKPYVIPEKFMHNPTDAPPPASEPE